MLAGLYIAAGVVFAGALLWRGLGKIDPAAGRSGWPFRMLIFPGLVALWPVCAAKWLR